MKDTPARLRMFAGPNGSGKSTIKSVIDSTLLGMYLNPDEIEDKIRKEGVLDLTAYQIQTNAKEILHFFAHSPLLEKADLGDSVRSLRFVDNRLLFQKVKINAYFASIAVAFIRNKLVEHKKSFTIETVMSSPDKIELLREAQRVGYRTYLYYVATEDPDINISRIQHRVKMGGHSVPEDKIVTRYHRSLDLLVEAIQCSHRAYIFDNSSHEHIWLAEITSGVSLEMKASPMPSWFKNAVWNKFDIKEKKE